MLAVYIKVMIKKNINAVSGLQNLERFGTHEFHTILYLYKIVVLVFIRCSLIKTNDVKRSFTKL